MYNHLLSFLFAILLSFSIFYSSFTFLVLRKLTPPFLLHELSSKLCLIQDVWTVEGNLHEFIGASVSYIKNNWMYVVRHLSMKLVAWYHKGNLLAEPRVPILKKKTSIKR